MSTEWIGGKPEEPARKREEDTAYKWKPEKSGMSIGLKVFYFVLSVAGISVVLSVMSHVHIVFT